ncbi:30S ribosomal protein S17 [Rickettsiales bacterium LUAb2]
MPKRILEGRVVSDKMDKTAVIEVSRRIKHPLYKKYIVKSNKYLAHDENNTAKEGDWVKIIENKPMSKRKTWLLVTKENS